MSFYSQSKLQTIIAVIAAVSLSGCALIPGWDAERSVTVNKKAVARTPLNLPPAPALRPTAVQWIVVTPENVDQVWEDLRKKNSTLVLFAITDNGYEELAMDMAQIRSYIANQNKIIATYKEYYEPPSKDGSTDGKQSQ